MEDYHTAGQFQPSAARPKLYLVKSAPADNLDAYGRPAIASECYLCGQGFKEADLPQLEWPLVDEPAHKACYDQHCEDYDRWSAINGPMRGA